MTRTGIVPRGLFTPVREYEAAIEKKTRDDAWISFLWRVHWQVYMIGTFRQPVSEEQARRSGVAFIQSLNPHAYGLVAWGRGSDGDRSHVHLLVGGVWTGRPAKTGINRVALSMKAMERQWPHGMVAKIERFDAARRSTYLVDHHELELVGKPKRHRQR